MSDQAASHSTSTPPSFAEFEAWPSDRIRPLVNDKTVIFSPGGSSRWYFLEHGDASVGYDDAKVFDVYSRRTLNRILELVNMMFHDGVGTVFVIGTTPKQSNRTAEYNQNLGRALSLLVDEQTQALYDQHQMGVVFRGAWERTFERFGVTHLLEECQELEQQSASEEGQWLIWVTEDDPIPNSLIPFVIQFHEETGQAPDRAALCMAYYGRALKHADMFIGNNKPTVEGQLPPLLTIGDLYFTVNPCLGMDERQWRSILYDHLFARRGHYRDYTVMGPEVFQEFRAFYKANQGVTLGVGAHHAPSRTWRPTLLSSPKADD